MFSMEKTIDTSSFKISKSARNHVKKIMKRNHSLLVRLKNL